MTSNAAAGPTASIVPPIMYYDDDLDIIYDTTPLAGDNLSNSFCPEHNLKSRIIQVSVSSTCLISAVVLRAIFFKERNENPIAVPICNLVMGMGVQGMIQSAYPESFNRKQKSFIADYATPIFLIISQVYDNLSKPSLVAKDGVFTGLTIYGGMVLASFVHSIFLNRRPNSPDVVALNRNDPSAKLKVITNDTSQKRLTMAAIITITGVGLILTGSFYKPAEIARDFGIIMTGEGGARIGSEIWLQLVLSAEGKDRSSSKGEDRLLLDDSFVPASVKVYTAVNRICLIAFHALPGIAIVGAGVAGSQNIPALSYVLFALTGVASGWNNHLRGARFTEVPCTYLYELHKFPYGNKNLLKRIFQVGKWFVGVPGVLAFLGLSIAGLDPSTGKFKKVDPFDIAALITFGAFLYGSYVAAEVSKRVFDLEENTTISNTADLEENTTISNTAYFYTHFSIGVPLVALYIMEKILINDRAISSDSTLEGTLACVAYGSLGWAIGAEANSRFDFPNPRVSSSLYFALFGRFFANMLLQKI